MVGGVARSYDVPPVPETFPNVPSFLTAWRLLDDGRHRAEFYRMWRAGHSAGFTIPRSLELMGPRGGAHVDSARQWLLAVVARGEDLSRAVQRGGDRFEEFEASMLTLGDESGTLDESLRLLAEFYTRKFRLMLSVRKKMAYPMYTMFFATLIAPFPLLYFGHALAYFSTVAAGVSALVVFGGSLVAAVANHYGRSPALVRARLARSLTTAIEAGMPLGRALRLSANASADPAVKAWIQNIDERALSGQEIAVTFAHCPHMTPDFLAVLKTAERTGDFTTSMRRLAELYEDGFR